MVFLWKGSIHLKIDDILGQVDTRSDELIQLISDLLSYQTEAPPARNTAAIQDYISKQLQMMNLNVEQWELYPGDPIVVGVKKGKSPNTYQSLILNGHVDVASVGSDEEWEHEPFNPFGENGMLYGRGAADMKGGLGACLFALKLLHDNNVNLQGDVIFQSVTGEEVGEAGTKSCCERGYKADYALVADTSNCELHGQGGVITGWITLKSPTTHHDGTRHQMIHAGGGVKAASAIEKMAKLMNALQELERDWAVTKSYPGFPAGANTINPAVIEGGRHAAFIADECRLWITVHFYPNETADSVAKEIEAHLFAAAQADVWMKDHPPTFTWGGSSMIEDRGEVFPSFSIDENHRGALTLKEAHKSIFLSDAQVGMSSSVNDGGWLAEYGIPTVCYGPGELKHAHAVDEHVEIKQLILYTKSILQFMLNWCNQSKEERSHDIYEAN